MKKIALGLLAVGLAISGCKKEMIQNSVDELNDMNYKQGDKVTLCHLDEYGNYITITVAPAAVAAHLAHGDLYPNPDGSCGPMPPEVNSGWKAVTKAGEARWRNFRTSNSGWDVAVGASAGTTGQFAQNDFGNLWNFAPDANQVTFTYDANAGTLSTITTVSGGNTFNASYNSGNLGNVNYMQWQVNGDPGKILEFNNVQLTVNGQTYNLGNFQTEYGDWYIDYDLSSGFTITGEMVINGAATNQEGMKLNITIGEYTP